MGSTEPSESARGTTPSRDVFDCVFKAKTIQALDGRMLGSHGYSARMTREGGTHNATTAMDGSTSLDELADPRAYLQRRVALYSKVVCLFVAGLTLLDLSFTLEGEALLGVTRIGGAVTCLVFGAIWWVTSRSEQSMFALRAGEIAATLVCFTTVSLWPVFPPVDGTGGAIGLVLAIPFACLTMLRAAIVPSTARLTLLIGLVGTAGLALGSYCGWHGSMPVPGLTGPEIGGAFNTVAGVAVSICGTVTSRVVHRLQRRVREVMQLGQYTLEEKIGEGGMGVVYSARHALLRRPTAVKLLPPDKAGKQAIARFEREVQQTSRLTHPNTVAVYDFGHTADGVFYYAMEYLDGIALDELVELAGPQPAERVIHIVAQVAGALAEAHSIGLIHRDVKPANIMLCHRGDSADTVKVLDFGLVKDIAAPKELALSGTATIIGTPLYLAPESLTEPDAVDGRTDIYALGVVAYYLLTGQPVFNGRSVVEVCSHHLHTEPTPPSQRRSNSIGEDLEAIVLRCLAKKQKDRPSAHELREALLSCSAASLWSRERADAWWKEHAEDILRHRHDRRGSTDVPAIALTIALEPRGNRF